MAVECKLTTAQGQHALFHVTFVSQVIAAPMIPLELAAAHQPLQNLPKTTALMRCGDVQRDHQIAPGGRRSLASQQAEEGRSIE